MSNNPYEAPSADVEIMETQLDIPEEVEKRIRNAVGAGIFTGAVTLIISVIALVTHTPVLGIDGWSVIDAALIAGLTFGIYKKNRTCAVIMLIYYAGTKILQIVTTHAMSGGILGVLFCYLFLMGAVGTFQYHQIKNEAGRI